MSKSLGNSPDPLDLIDRYGADGVRMGMMLSAPAGNDILFDDALCEQGRNFNNKIWNAFRLIKGWEVSAEVPMPEAAGLAMRWFESKQNAVAAEVADLFGKYRLSEALMAVYKLFWDEFSSWYLEMINLLMASPSTKRCTKRLSASSITCCICCIRSCRSSPRSCGSISSTVKTGRALW